MCLAVLVGVAAVSGVHAFSPATPPANGTAASGPAGSGAEFAYLAMQHSNYCSLAQSMVMGYADSQRLQGACCNAMDQAKYQHQVSALRQYQQISEVPPDPYDVPVSVAKTLLQHDTTITLTPSQQATFDTAMTMTDDHAPCCCQCWRWYAIRGLDKLLITRYQEDAATVALLTDLVNGCGGPLDHSRSSQPSLSAMSRSPGVMVRSRGA